MTKIIILQENANPITIETEGVVIVYNDAKEVFSNLNKQNTHYYLNKSNASLLVEDIFKEIDGAE